MLRRSEGTRFFVPERRRSRRLPGAIRAGDVRAADLQEKSTKRVETELILRHARFVGFDEDGGSPANIASERSEPFERASLASGAIQHSKVTG
jgi:hypothetical protein